MGDKTPIEEKANFVVLEEIRKKLTRKLDEKDKTIDEKDREIAELKKLLEKF